MRSRTDASFSSAFFRLLLLLAVAVAVPAGQEPVEGVVVLVRGGVVGRRRDQRRRLLPLLLVAPLPLARQPAPPARRRCRRRRRRQARGRGRQTRRSLAPEHPRGRRACRVSTWLASCTSAPSQRACAPARGQARLVHGEVGGRHVVEVAVVGLRGVADLAPDVVLDVHDLLPGLHHARDLLALSQLDVLGRHLDHVRDGALHRADLHLVAHDLDVLALVAFRNAADTPATRHSASGHVRARSSRSPSTPPASASPAAATRTSGATAPATPPTTSTARGRPRRVGARRRRRLRSWRAASPLTPTKAAWATPGSSLSSASTASWAAPRSAPPASRSRRRAPPS